MIFHFERRLYAILKLPMYQIILMVVKKIDESKLFANFNLFRRDVKRHIINHLLKKRLLTS